MFSFFDAVGPQFFFVFFVTFVNNVVWRLLWHRHCRTVGFGGCDGERGEEVEKSGRWLDRSGEIVVVEVAVLKVWLGTVSVEVVVESGCDDSWFIKDSVEAVVEIFGMMLVMILYWDN